MTTEVCRDGSVYDLQDPLRAAVERNVHVVFLLAVTFSFAFLPPKLSWGVATGGGLALFSFLSLRRTLEKAFTFILSGGRGAEGYVVMRHYLKLAFLFTLLFLLLKEGVVEAIGVAIGLFVVPAALIFSGVRLYISNLGGGR